MKRHKRLGCDRLVVKLKNRRVIAGIYCNGDIIFKFKRLVGRNEIAQETLRVSAEAADAMIALISTLRLEHPEAAKMRGQYGQEKG